MNLLQRWSAPFFCAGRLESLVLSLVKAVPHLEVLVLVSASPALVFSFDQK